MPLKKGYSKKTIGENIKSEMKRGKSKEQATAIAMDIARKTAKKAKKSSKAPAKPTSTKKKPTTKAKKRK